MNTPTPLKGSVNLRTRITLSFIALAFLVSGLTIAFVYFYYRDQLRNSLRQRLVSIVTIAALQIDGDQFSTIGSADDQQYIEIWTRNTEILESEKDLVFLYTMRYDDEGIYFVVDAGDPTSDGFSSFGTRYYEPGPTLLENYTSITEAMSERDFYEDEYGRFLSAYAPIYNQADQVTGIVGADISANDVANSERQLLIISFGIFAATLPVLGLLGWLLGRTLTAPILALAEAASRIAKGEINYRPFIATRVPEYLTLNQSFFTMADENKTLIETLEERVTTRTEELNVATDQLRTRASQMETIAEVTHSVLLVQDIDQALNSIVTIISDRFHFYHTGIFLLDELREYAVLQATNSPGGQRMLSRGHKLRVGEVGIVGYVAGSGKARIALDVGRDAIFFNNPDLPETRSEMALPLMVRDIVIGVLDIQSHETAAFSDEDISVFHILSDQVAIAIENARLFGETKRALAVAEKTYSDSVHSGWQQYAQEKTIPSVSYSTKTDRIVETQADYQEITEAVNSGQVLAKTEQVSTLAIPLVVRGYALGALDIRVPEKYVWSQVEIDTLKRIADRLALAMENARLYEDTKLRGTKEQMISEISTKITTSINIRNVLQTAVEELGRAIPESEIEIHLQE